MAIAGPGFACATICPSTAGSAFAFSFSDILAVLAGSANAVLDIKLQSDSELVLVYM